MTQSNETVFVSMRRYRSKVLIPYDVGCLHGPVFGKLLMLSYQYYESMRNCVATARKIWGAVWGDAGQSEKWCNHINSNGVIPSGLTLAQLEERQTVIGNLLIWMSPVRTRQLRYIFPLTYRNLFNIMDLLSQKVSRKLVWLGIIPL